MKAPFGWTVIAKGGDVTNVVVYKRERDLNEWTEDLKPHTYDTKAKAKAAGAAGFFAYGGKVPEAK
jgi:hypothetical protein